MAITTESLFASLNGMVIYTSAVLAISKHLSDRHKDIIYEIKERLSVIDLSKSDSNTALQGIRKEWDILLATEPVNADRLILALLIGLLSFPVAHITLHFFPFQLQKYSFCIGLVYLALLGISGWLGFTIYAMKRQRVKFDKNHRDLKGQYDLVSEAINCERGKQ